MLKTRHDGESDGLLDGFGLSGLFTPPDFHVDPTVPTAAELRRATLHANYVSQVDISAGGGFGTLYEPADDTRYPGGEYRAFVGQGINRATLMLHLPDSFDVENPCLVVAPSSGSRNAYGAVGTSGEWGLAKGCAVTYTDANKGTGAVERTQNTGFNLSLQAIDLASSTDEPTFVVPTSTRRRLCRHLVTELCGGTSLRGCKPASIRVQARTLAKEYRERLGVAYP